MAGRWRVIAGLVPAAVATAEVFGDDPRARLLPGEEAAVARAQPARVREFATGRACARRALAALGLPEVPVPRGPRGAPGWPSGVVGAITHCPGYRAAVAARATDARALGIDAEPDAPLPPGVGRRVAPGGAGPGLGGVHADRLLFSAKESVYKAWHPLTGRGLGFADVEVRLDAGGRFHVRLGVPAPELAGDLLEGRWTAARGLLVTAVVLRS